MDFKAPLSAERAVAEILARLHEIAMIAGLAEGLPPTLHKVITDGIVQASVHVTRAAPRAGVTEDEWPECDRDVYAVVLAAAPRPITCPQIMAALEAAGNTRSVISVKRALGRLRGRGRVASSRQSPRGYRVPDGPSDRHPELFDGQQ